MHAKFLQIVEALEPKFQKLLNSPPAKYRDLHQDLPTRAVYLFSQDQSHLYVGRTNSLRSRLRGHCIPSATHFTATFAFRIDREATGFKKATYTSEGSRANLCKDPVFGPAFLDAKRRVSNMDIRFIEEPDPLKQALLEIYAATVLCTPYNDFENH